MAQSGLVVGTAAAEMADRGDPTHSAPERRRWPEEIGGGRQPASCRAQSCRPLRLPPGGSASGRRTCSGTAPGRSRGHGTAETQGRSPSRSSPVKSPPKRVHFQPQSREGVSAPKEDSVAGSGSQLWMGSKEKLGAPGGRALEPEARAVGQRSFDVKLHSPGFHVWRLERKSFILVGENDLGFFHEASCYLLARRYKNQEVSLHYWVGLAATEKDETFIHEKACALDRTLGRIAFFSAEYQCHESAELLRNFPDGIIHIEGREHTAIDRAAAYRKRLYVISGRKYIRATCMLPAVASLKNCQAAILDGYPRVYVWVSANCCYDIRVKTIQLARKMRNCQRKGRGHIIVIDERDVAMHKSFLKKLVDGCEEGQGQGQQEQQQQEQQEEEEQVEEDGKSVASDVDQASCTSSSVPATFSPSSSDSQTCPQANMGTSLASLYRIAGNHVQYDMPFVCSTPIHARYLNSQDSFLLEQGETRPLFVWVGSQAPSSSWTQALSRGKAFAAHKKFGRERSVCRVRAGMEPPTFRHAFLDWQERSLGSKSLTRCFSISNVARVLFSRSDRRTVGPLVEVKPQEEVTEADGTTESYVLQGGELTSLPWSHQGIFTNSYCYVILHSALTDNDSHMSQIIYYWLGAKASSEDHKRTADLALDMDAAFGHTTVIARALDGKEPSHFLSILEDAMIVYDRDLQQAMKSTGVHLYRVEQFGKESMRVTQVPASASSLKSSSTVVVLTSSDVFLWFGKESGSAEREYAKNMLSFLDPSRMYQYEVVLEEREPQVFWQTLGGRRRALPPSPSQVLERRTARVVHCDVTSSPPTFTDIPDHCQQDLSEDCVMVLDTFDEVYLWSGQEIGEEVRGKLIHQVFPAYMAVAGAGRNADDVHLRLTSQNSEPKNFTRNFLEWTECGYGGSDLYDLTRKQIRQENTKIDVEVQLVDRSKAKLSKYQYKDLMKKELPPDVLVGHKEYHLSDRHFNEVLKVNRFHFYRLPDWKQFQILRSARLAPPQPHSSLFHHPEVSSEKC